MKKLSVSAPGTAWRVTEGLDTDIRTILAAAKRRVPTGSRLQRAAKK